MVINSDPFVSIITPVYNGSEYLEELIQSVRSQEYSNVEHIIIDDGSRDNGSTLAVLNKYPHLRWWSHANKGQYATMNDGLEAARGEIICFVSADDTVSPNAVKTAVQYMMEHPQMDGVFGITRYMDETGKEQSYPIPFRLAPIRFYPYFAHISHCSLYVRKQSIVRHGLFFDPSLRFVGDYEWITRIHKAGLRIGMIRRELSKVRIHTDQTSQKNRDASTQEARTVLKTQQVNRVSYFLMSGINLFLIRAWKLSHMLKSTGVRAMVTYLAKRNSHL